MKARDVLEAFFFDLLDDPSEEVFAALCRAHPDAVEAALAYLRARYIDGVAPTAPWETMAPFISVVRMILVSGGPAAARALFAIAIDAPDPRQQRALADIVLGVLPPDELARALIAALMLGPADPLAVNARELAYHTFGAAGDDYAPSAALRDQLAASLAASRSGPAARP